MKTSTQNALRHIATLIHNCKKMQSLITKRIDQFTTPITLKGKTPQRAHTKFYINHQLVWYKTPYRITRFIDFTHKAHHGTPPWFLVYLQTILERPFLANSTTHGRQEQSIRNKNPRKLPTHNDNDILKRSRHVLFILGVNQNRCNAALIDPCARSQATIYRS